MAGQMGYRYYQIESFKNESDIQSFLEAAKPYLDNFGYTATAVDNHLIRFDFGDDHHHLENGTDPSKIDNLIDILCQKNFVDLVTDFPRFDLKVPRQLINHSAGFMLKPIHDSLGNAVEALVSDPYMFSIKSLVEVERTENGTKITFTDTEQHEVEVEGATHKYNCQYVWLVRNDLPLTSFPTNTLDLDTNLKASEQVRKLTDLLGYQGLAGLINPELKSLIFTATSQDESTLDRFFGTTEVFFASKAAKATEELVGQSLLASLGFNNLEELGELLDLWLIPYAKVEYTRAKKELTTEQFMRIGPPAPEPDLVAVAQTTSDGGPLELVLTERVHLQNGDSYIKFRDQIFADEYGAIWCCLIGSDPLRVDRFLQPHVSEQLRETIVVSPVTDVFAKTVNIGRIPVAIPPELRSRTFPPGTPVSATIRNGRNVTRYSTTATVTIGAGGQLCVTSLESKTFKDVLKANRQS